MPSLKPFPAALSALAAAVLLLFPCGCRGAPGGRTGGGAFFDPVRLGSAAFSLLPPACIETPLDMLQRLSGEYGERRFEVNAWVRADASGVMVELFNDLGAGLGELVYTETELRLDSPYFPPNLKPEYAAADFQFCFYREDALRGALSPLRLESSRAGDAQIRRIVEKDKTLVEIVKRPGELCYVNHFRGYSYTILGDFPP